MDSFFDATTTWRLTSEKTCQVAKIKITKNLLISRLARYGGLIRKFNTLRDNPVVKGVDEMVFQKPVIDLH